MLTLNSDIVVQVLWALFLLPLFTVVFVKQFTWVKKVWHPPG